MYGIDESKPNTTYSDGYGRFCAIVTTTTNRGDDWITARQLIREALYQRGYHLSFNVELVEVTKHGTSIYREN